MHKRTLQIPFAFILVSLSAVNLWAIATLIDAYYGFLTFYAWVLWKEVRALPRALWLVAIMLLGNIAMSAYVLRQLARLKPSDSAETLLAARNS